MMTLPNQESGRLYGEAELSLCGEPAVELNGRRWQPDETTAYLKCNLSFGFPNVSWYGDGILPSVLAASAGTMRFKPLNLAHQMKVYGAPRDRILGASVDVCLSQRGQLLEVGTRASWPPGAEKAEAVSLVVVCALWKTAEGADRILGKHQSGRKRFVVSQEVLYEPKDGGFAVRRAAGAAKLPTTPEDLWAAGWDYVPVMAADEALLRTRDWENRRMAGRGPGGACVGSYQGRDTYFLYGGLAATNHYAGIGVVEFGAEPGATIEQVLASHDELEALAAALDQLRQALALGPAAAPVPA